MGGMNGRERIGWKGENNMELLGQAGYLVMGLGVMMFVVAVVRLGRNGR